jgi:dephospho-CoA kinase
MIIGVTGKSGSGKSTFAKNYAKENNFIYINIDEIGHEVLEENKYTIEAWFNTTNRKEIGEILFNNRVLYKEFCDAVWKIMEKKIDRIIENNENIILDFILLPHTKYWNVCYKILIKCPSNIRKQRIIKRDEITEEYFNLREKNSIEYDENIMDEIIYMD